MKLVPFLIVAVLAICLNVQAQSPEKPEAIDWDKARSLYQREQNGDKLSADERTYLDRAKKQRQQMQRANPAATQRATTQPARESTGMIPLTQLKGDQTYKGVDGGLYGHGLNDPPTKLLQAALEAAGKIEPLGADGKSSREGKVVLMSIGMSNTTMEFSRFKLLADREPTKSSRLLIVDTAQGGQDARKWDTATDPSPWSIADARLKSAGASPQQVQIIWLKQAIAGAGNSGEFPKHSDELKQRIELSLKLATARYPNLKLVYLSSRIYAGYAATALNPEPYAYEGAFAMRGVIVDRMTGDLKSPIVLWGPYLWADGIKGRAADALVWKREDFAADGTHPGDSGRQKVAELLLGFFKSDQTARTWFVDKPQKGIE